jgi:hypothetical protein
MDLPETLFAKDQHKFTPFPAYKANDPEGTVVSRWTFTWMERLQILFGGSVWHSQLTFHHNLQAVKMGTVCPIKNPEAAYDHKLPR